MSLIDLRGGIDNDYFSVTIHAYITCKASIWNTNGKFILSGLAICILRAKNTLYLVIILSILIKYHKF